MFEVVLSQSAGLRNDRGRKFIPNDFYFNINNYNYDNIIGADRIKCPNIEYDSSLSFGIDGIFQYRYIDATSTLKKLNIVVVGGNVVIHAINSGTPASTIYTGLTENNKCSFAVLNDKLFISNGVDNVIVYDGTYVTEMGAPTAKNLGSAGVLTGDYYYAMSYVVDGVELITGTISNTVTVSSNSITVTLPIGPTGTTERKLYRTEAGGSALKLLTTISNNTDTTYTDNTADGSLGADIGAVNSPAPKPKFITVMNEKLIGVGVTRRPNYIYYSEAEIESLFATIGAADVSGRGNDNTGLTGMELDYDQLVVFSEKRIYTVDVSGTTASIKQTTSNVGCLDGHSVAKVPPSHSFRGGLMFVSNEYDIRVFNGNLAVNLATSFDNLNTENFSAQLNKDDMKNILSNVELEGEFFDYKYHLIIGSSIYIYDIRIQGWSKYRIVTATYSPTYRKMGILGDKFYIGQSGTGIVEEMYINEQYRSEDLASTFETPELLVSSDYKFFKGLYVYYGNSGDVTVNVITTPDDNSDLSSTSSFSYTGDGFDANYYNSTYYETSTNVDSYKYIHINQYARWIRFRFTTNNRFNFRGLKLVGRTITNKEV